ncbi:hypothetical protein A3724_02080 [Alcanivorax sp. HI0033]|nr:hypothetical protein A3713_16605 [Alcanivorax sp. HI0003]KZX72937.1 hypothetical protein A3714_15515 [Alcanivorax sp. HI0007]KZX77452.1 hypothetical protein A3716_09035 [Alcanivorax sp. HI0011]KZX82894.1 hypothetical protein A3717_18080 [Alcanivorax sp. HI0013]KZY11127.1 hypothetical protein A3724_02080 [Alcanivorax sp. HI0033]KZY17963.1 hypothetical protein A3725_37990 [Alcanivorax sp. HI0035]
MRNVLINTLLCTMKTSYEKLLQPSEFANDEPVGLAALDKSLLPGPIEEKYWTYISERLWSRIISYGAAYQLHFHQLVEPVVDTVLNPLQCDSLGEELEFLSGVANDPALLEALSVLRNEVYKVVNRKSMCLVISPP